MSKDEYLIADEPLKALNVFSMPMILGSFFQQVYNMARTEQKEGVPENRPVHLLYFVCLS